MIDNRQICALYFMKKYFYVAAVAAIALTGCAKTDVAVSEEGDRVISFDTYTQRTSTRASVITTDTLKASASGFGVFAYYTAQNNYSSSTKPDFMYDQAVVYNQGTSKWEYSPVKFWPNKTGDKVSFFAYAPKADSHISNISGNNVAGDPTMTFSIDTAIVRQIDFLVADPMTNLTKQQVGGKVSFNFKHALSRIGLKVQAVVDFVNPDADGDDDDDNTSSQLDTNTTITINEVKLIGDFAKSGSVNLNTRAWTLSSQHDTAFVWKSANMVPSVRSHVTSEIQDLVSDGNYLMIFPATMNCKLMVDYTVSTNDSALQNCSVMNNVVLSSPFPYTFDAGKAYSINIHIGLTSVQFDVNVTPWDVVTPGVVVNAPVNS